MTQFTDDCREIQEQIERTAETIQNWMSNLFLPFDQLQTKWQAVEQSASEMNQTIGQIRPYFSNVESSQKKGAPRRKSGAKKWVISENLRLIQEHGLNMHHLLIDNERLNHELKHMSDAEDDGEHGLESSIAQVVETQRIIIDVKFISLNAIIFAIHLGGTGASFERVSDHLHETSVYLDKTFTEIIELLNTVVQWNEDFKAHLHGILETQTKMNAVVVPQFPKLIEKASNASGGLEQYYREVSALMDMLNSDYGLMVSKLKEKANYSAMLDKWLDAYELVREQFERFTELANYGAPIEQQLDYATFISKGFDAIINISGFAVDGVGRYSEDIYDIAKEGSERIQEIQPSMRALAEQFSGKSKPTEGQTNYANGIVEFLDDLNMHIAQVSIIQTCLDDCAPFNAQINEHFHNLENGIKDVSQEVSMLDIIRFLSHVELAKVDQQTLKSFGIEIDGVVSDVTAAIAGNSESLALVKRSMHKMLEGFKDVRLASQRRYNDEMYFIDTAKDRLKTIQTSLVNGFASMSVAADTVVTSYEHVVEAMGPMKMAAGETSDLINEIGNIRDQFASIRQLLLNQHQVMKWDIKNPELSEMASKFQDVIMEFQLMNQSKKSRTA